MRRVARVPKGEVHYAQSGHVPKEERCTMRRVAHVPREREERESHPRVEDGRRERTTLRIIPSTYSSVCQRGSLAA